MFHARAATPADRESLVGWMHALYAEDPSPEPMTREKAARTPEALERDPSRGQAVVLETWLVRSLLERSTPWFRDAVAFELEVSPRNPRARALYERLGFRAKSNAVLRIKG